jgi:hypothetical protein
LSRLLGRVSCWTARWFGSGVTCWWWSRCYRISCRCTRRPGGR